MVTDLDKFEDELNWLIHRYMILKMTFNAVFAVSEVSKETDALHRYGDFIGFAQGIMMDDLLLTLSKLLIDSKGSVSIPRIIHLAIQIFTPEYDRNTRYSKYKKYGELKAILMNMDSDMHSFSNLIDRIRTVRDQELAHWDKKVDTYEKRESLYQDNPIALADVIHLIDFIGETLQNIKAIVLGKYPRMEIREYERELRQIAEAIESSTAD
mgnify:CR=1 FL=1